MISARRQRTVPDQRLSADPDGSGDLRRMVLLLETAAVLEARARRSEDPAQVAVLLRRAEHRRREATELREQLAARGAALPPAQAQRFSATPTPAGTVQGAVPRPVGAPATLVRTTGATSPRRRPEGMAESSE
jgi:hypothetical protein